MEVQVLQVIGGLQTLALMLLLDMEHFLVKKFGMYLEEPGLSKMFQTVMTTLRLQVNFV